MICNKPECECFPAFPEPESLRETEWDRIWLMCLCFFFGGMFGFVIGVMI